MREAFLGSYELQYQQAAMCWDGATTAAKDPGSLLVVTVVQYRREHVAICAWRDPVEEVSGYRFGAIGEPGCRKLTCARSKVYGRSKSVPRKCGH